MPPDLALLYFLLPDITERGHILHALYIGLKFDARMAVFMALPLAFCLLWPRLERAVSREGASFARKALCLVTGLMAAGAMLVYVFDFGFFFYLHQHIDMGAKVFLEDPSESVRMVWQSYPVPLIVAAFAVAEALYVWLFARFSALPRGVSPSVRKWAGKAAPASGAPSSPRPRWSCSSSWATDRSAPTSSPCAGATPISVSDKNIAILAVNPIQNLYDTRNYGKALPPNIEATREAWPRMAAYLRVPEGAEPLTYVRHFPGRAMEKAPEHRDSHHGIPVLGAHVPRAFHARFPRPGY